MPISVLCLWIFQSFVFWKLYFALYVWQNFQTILVVMMTFAPCTFRAHPALWTWQRPSTCSHWSLGGIPRFVNLVKQHLTKQVISNIKLIMNKEPPLKYLRSLSIPRLGMLHRWQNCFSAQIVNNYDGYLNHRECMVFIRRVFRTIGWNRLMYILMGKRSPSKQSRG